MLEQRAAVNVTGNEEGNTTPWIQRVLPGSAAAFCGIDVQMADVGEVLVPVITTGVTIGFVAAGAAQAESSPAAAVTTLTPRRGTGNFPVNKEDLAKFPRHGRRLADGAHRGRPERDRRRPSEAVR